MARKVNSKEETRIDQNDEMDRGAINDQFNSDNAFSNQGLNNADLTRDVVNRKNPR